MDAALHSSARHDWQTPDEVLDRVVALGDGCIALDPCTSPDNPTGAAETFTEAQDGLVQPWPGRGLVYVNPPYGRALGDWSRKIVHEAERGCEIAALTPARPDTQWFHLLWARANAVCLWRGRLTFRGAPAPAPFPSAVWYFGRYQRLFATAFRDAGILEVLR